MGKKVSLVLSSGGARGVAHIGVIEELERQGFEIVSIAGTSMGALVGGVYASGNLEKFRNWMCQLDKKDVFNLVDFTLSTKGLVKGMRLIKELKKIVPDINIEDLPILYTAVAVDIKSRNEVLFRKGSLYNAIRASISIPTVFTPLKLDGMILIDGGVMNPVPINHVSRGDDDIVIAVDVSYQTGLDKCKDNSKKEEVDINFFSLLKEKGFSFLTNVKGEQINYYTLLTQSSSLMIRQISNLTLSMYRPDILIRVPLESVGSFHFYKSQEIVERGRLATREALFDYESNCIKNGKTKSSCFNLQ